MTKHTTEIIKIKGDWQEVVDDCRTTVGKPPLGREPSTEFRQKILIAEHSPRLLGNANLPIIRQRCLKSTGRTYRAGGISGR